MFSKRNKKINNSEPNKVCCWSLLAILGFGLFSYGYLVRGITVNVVSRQNLETEISLMSSRILDLESEYLTIKNDITLEKAHNLGFIPVTHQSFADRNTVTPGLTLVSVDN